MLAKTKPGNAPANEGTSFMSDRQLDLRTNRSARLNGGRPAPLQRYESQRKTAARVPENTEDDSSLMPGPLRLKPPPPPKEIDASRVRGNLSTSPSVIYLEDGARQTERQEAHSLRMALEGMDIAEEQWIHDAAQAQASELVLEHTSTVKKSKDWGYTNPDLRPRDRTIHPRQRSSQTHATQREDISTAAPTLSTKKSLGSFRFGHRPSHDPMPSSTQDAPVPALPKKKGYHGLANAVAADIANIKRRVSSGGTRVVSGGKRKASHDKFSFPNVTDKIYEEPEVIHEEEPKKVRFAIPEPAQTPAEEAPAPNVPRHVRKNPFARMRHDKDNLERANSVASNHASRIDPVEIQKNPPTQTRRPWYMSNKPSLRDLSSSEGQVHPNEETRKSADGIEIRGDDIRAATSVKRKDRSPNLPQPTAVSDAPDRPIVSFHSDWQQAEEKRRDSSSSPSKATPRNSWGSRADVPHLPSRSSNRSSASTIDRSGLPKAEDKPDRHTQYSNNSPSLTSSIPNGIPILNLPDDDDGSSSRVLAEEPLIPHVNLLQSKPDLRPAPRQPVPHETGTSPNRLDSTDNVRPRPLPIPVPPRNPARQSGPAPAQQQQGMHMPHVTPYQKRDAVLCAHCALPIAGRIVTAAGERFHPECFSCHHCGINLECVAFYPEPDRKYYERLARIQQRMQGFEIVMPEGSTEEDAMRLEQADGDESLRFFCHLDYHELFSPRCKSCSTPIEGEVVVACGAEWHVGHFFCAQCGDPFDSSMPFVEKDGYAWCLGCHTNRYSPKCKKCRKPVTDIVVNALGHDWHTECFCCCECGGHFDDGQYFLRGDSTDPPTRPQTSFGPEHAWPGSPSHPSVASITPEVQDFCWTATGEPRLQQANEHTRVLPSLARPSNIDLKKASTDQKSENPSIEQNTPVQRRRRLRNEPALGGFARPTASPASVEPHARYFTPASHPRRLNSAQFSRTGRVLDEEHHFDSIPSVQYYTAHWRSPTRRFRDRVVEERERDGFGENTRFLSSTSGSEDSSIELSPSVARQLRSTNQTPTAGNLFGKKDDSCTVASTSYSAELSPSRHIKAHSPTLDMFASRWAPSQEPVPREVELEEAPPVPEKEYHVKPTPSVDDTKAVTAGSITHSTSTDPKKSPVRLKRTILVNGKNIRFLLPPGPPEQFGGRRPMSLNEANACMEHWKQAGYDVTGFDHDIDEDVHILDRQHFETLKLFDTTSKHPCSVNIPDPSAWNEYVKFVREEKLRALGVGSFEHSAGGNEQAPAQQMMRTVYPAISPVVPGPFGFVASSRSTPGLSAGSHSRTMSVVSPLSTGPDVRGHAHRHSVYGMPQDQSHINFFSPSVRSFSPLNPSNVPAAADSGLINRDPAVPKLPLHQDGQYHRASPFSDHHARWTPPMPGRDHFVPDAFASRTANASTTTSFSTISEIPRETIETGVPVTPIKTRSQPEIHEPTPRGHSYNVSDSLEREIREAEAAMELEDAAKLTTEHADSNPIPESNPFSFGQPQVSTMNNGFKFFGSNFVPSAPAFELKPSARQAPTPTLQSTTRLTPNAPMFEPSKPVGLGITAPPSNKRVAGVLNGQGVKLNVTAPAFQPGNAITQAASLPSRTFDFTSSHVFRPDASSFEPKKAAPAPTEHKSIFGNVQIPEMSLTSRRSKAVPIMRPTSSRLEPEEDAEGRLTQSAEWQKRAFRQADVEGDSLPLFAERPESPFRPKQDSTADGSPLRSRGAVRYESADEPEQPLDDDKVEKMETAVPSSPALVEPTSSPAIDQPKSTVLSALAESFTMGSPPRSDNVALSSDARKVSLEDRMPDLSPSRVFSRNFSGLSFETEPIAEPEKTAASSSIDSSPPAMTALPSEPNSDIVEELLEDREDSLQPEDADQEEESFERATSPRTVRMQASSPVISRSPSPLPADSPASAPFQALRAGQSSNFRPSSEWSADFTSGAASQVDNRSKFFDGRIEKVITKAIGSQLRPLRDQLGDVQQALSLFAHLQRSPRGKRVSSLPVESDADDEDDLSDSKHARPTSSAVSHRFQTTKAAVLEALSSQRPSSPDLTSHRRLTHMLDSVNERLDVLLEKNVDIRQISALVEETVQNAQKAIVCSPSTLSSPDNYDRDRRSRIEDELRLAYSELETLRMANAAKDDRIRNIEDRLTDLKAENTAQALTLDEYRASRTKWKQDKEDASEDKQRLLTTIGELEDQLADGLNIRNNMRTRLDRIHSDMAIAAEQLATQKVSWDHENEALSKRCAVLQARLDHDVDVRRAQEVELSRLQMLASEGEITRHQLQQSLADNAALDETIKDLRLAVNEQQEANASIERRTQIDRDERHAELQRVRSMMETAVETARAHGDAERAGLESKLAIANTELEGLRSLRETMKLRHEMLIEEESNLRRETLLKVNEANNVSLENLRKRHEEDIQAVEHRRSRALAEAQQEKERSESFWNERLSLSEGRNVHLLERIAHVEERLEIAKSAAQAAASAAQAARAGAKPTASPSSAERVSPQALRESILVLQDQLQDRERQIEQLRSQASETLSSVPPKLKEKDIEIAWLRELLAVRGEDLNELIDNLSQSHFNKEAARDTAIRIRTALQMEQAEKERHIAAGSSIPAQAMANLTNFASPKAAQLAAALGNWRARGTPSGPTPSSLRRQRQSQSQSGATPAKRPTSSSSWISGLMTPPASGPRRTPSPHSPSVAAQLNAANRPGSRDSQTSQASRKMSALVNHTNMPATPEGTPLSLRRGSFDDDAQLDADRELEGDEFSIASPIAIGQGRLGELEPLG